MLAMIPIRINNLREFYFASLSHCPRARAEVGAWTRELIALALRHGGRYCLPYPLHTTVEQFNVAYPEADRLRRIKQQVDPAGKLSNELWRKYL